MAAPSVIVAPSDVIPQGPFGGTGGDPFSDGVGEVVRISITYSSGVVYSVQADYRQKTTDVFSAAIHGYKGPKEEEIKLDFVNGERLLRVMGTTAPAEGESTDMVTSLTFITNTNTYGPYGAVVGRPFQSSVHGQVVGFFGRSGGLLDSFGTFTDFSKRETEVKLDGPWGGNEGNAFYDAPADKIKQVDVEYDRNAIISLNVTYDRGSQGYVPSKHGGGGSLKGTTKPIVFGNDEYLARVTGTTDLTYGSTLVKSLRLITNKDTYGPFGNTSGDKFETRPNSQILGFYGRSASALDQLGAFIGVPPSPSVETVASFGGQGGNAFYEGRGEISQIVVTFSKNLVVKLVKLQVTYLQGGEEFVGDVHGTGDGDVATITLNPPDEYLKQVTGTYDTGPGMNDVISSITFITYNKTTNKETTYGPYGNQDSGTPFASPDVGQIVGLFGRSSESLDQIGMICFPK